MPSEFCHMSHQDALDQVSSRFASREDAEHWYWNSCLLGYGRLTAANLVEQARWADLIEYLAAIDAGIHA